MMLVNKELTENYSKYTYKFYIGDHTTSGEIDVVIYEKDYILRLNKQIKELVKQREGLKVKRIYKQSEIKEMNIKLNDYIAEQKSFHDKLNEFPFLDQEFINREQMTQVCKLGNENGRRGSKSFLKYKDVREIIQHFEDVINTLENDHEGLCMIAV